ncbi:unnamed protein product [Leuciscus chuanchicus]
MLVEPEFIAAAILVPKFKTSWTSDENIVKLGLDYIKDHLEEETLNQPPADGSSGSEEEDFFASMKPTHGQEGIKQLDGYLACKADDKDILKSFPSVCKRKRGQQDVHAALVEMQAADEKQQEWLERMEERRDRRFELTLEDAREARRHEAELTRQHMEQSASFNQAFLGTLSQLVQALSSRPNPVP